MNVEITPEPDEPTRLAILAALAEEESEQAVPSPWAEQSLPRRDGEQDPAG